MRAGGRAPGAERRGGGVPAADAGGGARARRRRRRSGGAAARARGDAALSRPVVRARRCRSGATTAAPSRIWSPPSTRRTARATATRSTREVELATLRLRAVGKVAPLPPPVEPRDAGPVEIGRAALVVDRAHARRAAAAASPAGARRHRRRPRAHRRVLVDHAAAAGRARRSAAVGRAARDHERVGAPARSAS